VCVYVCMLHIENVLQYQSTVKLLVVRSYHYKN